MFQTLRMGSTMLEINPTWSTGSFDESLRQNSAKNLVQMSTSASNGPFSASNFSTSNGPLGVHTSVSMVASKNTGWPSMRLL